MSRLLTTSIILAVLLPIPEVRAQQTTVLTNAFENQVGERGLDWLGEGLALLIAERLSPQRQLYVFSIDERSAAYERLGIPGTVQVSRATALKVAWDIGADVLISGRFSGTHEEFRIDARVLDLDQARSGVDVTVTGRLDDVISLVASLSSRLSQALVPGSELPESDYAAQPPVPRSAFEAYVRGMLATDPQRHIELLEEAIRLHPQYSSALFQLGQTRYLDSDYKRSASLLEKVSTASPEYAMARFMLAMDHYRLGDGAKAAAILTSLPATYDVLVNLGASLALKGDLNGADTAWRRAVGLKRELPEAAFNLAHSAFVRLDNEVATTRLTQFLRTHGRDAEAQFLLGRVYERVGRTEDAQRLFTQATRQSPRLEKWLTSNVPNLTRVRTQFDPTEMRLPAGATLWTSARLARKTAVQDVSSPLLQIR